MNSFALLYLLLGTAATCSCTHPLQQHRRSLQTAQVGHANPAQRAWLLESNQRFGSLYKARTSFASTRQLKASQQVSQSAPTNPLVFCGATKEYECPPGTTCCCLGRTSHVTVGSPRCDWYCCKGSCCADRKHYCPQHLPQCDTAKGQCLPDSAPGIILAAEPFKSLPGGADSCQAATSRVHVVHLPGAASPGGSNVVKDSLNGFATHYMTGGTIVHDSLITAADYGPLKASSSSKP